MYSGLARLPLYPFVAVGVLVVLAAGTGLALVYVVGAMRGRRAALIYTRACEGVLVAGLLGDMAWAVASGQWSGFMREIGLSALWEMLVLAALLLFTVLFMAHRYIEGMTD